ATALAFVAAFVLLRRFETLRADFQNERLIRAIGEATAARLQATSTLPLASVHDAAHYYQTFADVPWDDLIKECSTVDICVHYFDTWIGDHSEELKNLFNRGGHVRIILPDYSNRRLVSSVKERFPEYSTEQID